MRALDMRVDFTVTPALVGVHLSDVEKIPPFYAPTESNPMPISHLTSRSARGGGRVGDNGYIRGGRYRSVSKGESREADSVAQTCLASAPLWRQDTVRGG